MAKELDFTVGGSILSKGQLLAQAEIEAVRLGRRKKTGGAKTRAAPDGWRKDPEAGESLGWVVAGFSPQRLADAQVAHDRLVRDLEDHNRYAATAAGKSAGAVRAKVPQPWDRDVYMRKSAPTKARPKPYELREAAEQCADMLRRQGWVNVSVKEDLRVFA
jgi:hypothetical protein